jgi:hypothetical protein
MLIIELRFLKADLEAKGGIGTFRLRDLKF